MSDSEEAPSTARHEYVVKLLPKCRLETAAKVVHVTLCSSGQHTLEWSAAFTVRVKDEILTLPAGSCNLYRYPTVWLDGLPPERTERLDGNREAALAFLILSLGCGAQCDFHSQVDSVGARPIHALMVCNTTESVGLSLRLLRHRPDVLLIAHGPGPFAGENLLHIITVNRQEPLLLELIELAITRLSPKELRQLFYSQAAGPFFDAMPMRYYGSSPVGYATCFGMKAAMAKLLLHPALQGVISLNDVDLACPITGFMPIHAATANGLRAMFTFLAGEGDGDGTGAGTTEIPALPEERRSDSSICTVVGKRLDLAGLSPLQLSAKLGNHAMFKHILRRQTVVLWKWGPVTQYMIDLVGIDSAGAQKAEDVMELVGAMDATPKTQELLLDHVMNGFVYSLFELKWTRFASLLHHILLFFDVSTAGFKPATCEMYHRPMPHSAIVRRVHSV